MSSDDGLSSSAGAAVATSAASIVAALSAAAFSTPAVAAALAVRPFLQQREPLPPQQPSLLRPGQRPQLAQPFAWRCFLLDPRSVRHHLRFVRCGR